MAAVVEGVKQEGFLTAEVVMTQVQQVMFQELAQRYYEEEAARMFKLHDEQLVFVAKVKAVMMGLM